MSRRVRVNSGYSNVYLPDGFTYTGQVEVVLTDAQYAVLPASLVSRGIVTDLGAVATPGSVTPPGGGSAPVFPIGGFLAAVTPNQPLGAAFGTPQGVMALSSPQDYPGVPPCAAIDTGDHVKILLDGLYAVSWFIQFANDATGPDMLFGALVESGDWIMNNNYQWTTKARVISFSRTMPLKTGERLSVFTANGGASASSIAQGSIDICKIG